MGNVDVNSPELLPAVLPADPMPLLESWFQAACRAGVQPNPDAMVVATATSDARPSARVVLLKHLIADPGYVVFFTNYESRKGRELKANPRAAAVLHWDALGRQVRLEGPVLPSPAGESDAYFATRPLDSRIGAWASLQSSALDARQSLLDRVAETRARFPHDVPRPPHWGGYRLWPDAVELWVEGAHRIHDRARWERSLAAGDRTGFRAGSWQATRLHP
jgi:pyridoxamine 5'-phosphate oxidase